MAAGAGRYQDQAGGALLDRLVREFLVDHVVKHDAAPAMRGLIEFFARAERGDDDRHLVLLARRQILIEPVWSGLCGGAPIGFPANGADSRSGCALSCAASSSLIRTSHSSSSAGGRAFSAGNDPTIPALHCAITRSGTEMMNSGAPITGIDRRPLNKAGMDIEKILIQRSRDALA